VFARDPSVGLTLLTLPLSCRIFIELPGNHQKAGFREPVKAKFAESLLRR
jgi:hypothetical protein